MKKRVISRWVIVSGSPFSSCSWKIGTTLPFEPSTLPKRTDTYGRPLRWAASATSISAIRLLAPITLDGRTALSVDTNTKRSTPAAMATSSMTVVPPMFTCTASEGCSSISGTCLYAAAWKMTLGACRLTNRSISARLATLARWMTTSPLPCPRRRRDSSSRWMR